MGHAHQSGDPSRLEELCDLMAYPSKIILIGFMGSGKSTVAEQLAPRLGYTGREMDSIIVERSGLSSIPEIFEKHGEPFFRTIESQVAQDLRNVTTAVVSTGGGVVTNPSNIENLRANGGLVIFLRTTFETICGRVTDISSRPLFRDGVQARALFEQRASVYEGHADLIIDTDRKTAEDICSEILSHLELRS